MAKKLTISDIEKRYVREDKILTDGYAKYKFNQDVYYNDFIKFYEKYGSTSYERIAELVEDDENGKDHSKKMKRWHILLLFGGEIKTKGTNKKLIRFINKMQKETDLFNKSKHTYINKI